MVKKTDCAQLRPKTSGQRAYKEALESATITICTGPAGTGKGFVACGVAADYFKRAQVQKIILTRPLVHCGRGQIGILPGELDDKLGPYFRVLQDLLGEFFSGGELNAYIGKKQIEFIPLELMRGMTIKNAFIIADEIQNAEFAQIKMLLTRIGEGSKMVLAGDVYQTDLGTKSALGEVSERLRGNRDIRRVQLTSKDIVRHPLIQFIDERLSDRQPESNADEAEEVRAKCPNCDVTMVYADDDVEQLKCWNCYRHIDFDEDDELFLSEDYLPRNMVTETRSEVL